MVSVFWSVLAHGVKGKRSQRTIYFISFRKKGFENRLHYINTPKQLILDFYDSAGKNDTFHLKIVIFLLLFCFHPAGDVLWVFVEPGNVVP